ncbi:MAG: hypothetical protein Q8S73_26675 [Deltaproteobacteria bacterium]|nr:hypothetical protein [Myxococcales bacterium]MDP3217721.1 hypothetical protein [Deltaproteobacteria bacterium]
MFILLFAALSLHAVTGWISAHPFEAFIALGAVLNLINGMLPATIRTGPVGTFLHVLLDRVVILTRRNAPGTLKWPIVAGSILRAVADSLNPPEAPADAVRLTSPTTAAQLAGEVVLQSRVDEVALGRPTVAPPQPIEPAAYDPTQTLTLDVTDQVREAARRRGEGGNARLVTLLVLFAALGLAALFGLPLLLPH